MTLIGATPPAPTAGAHLGVKVRQRVLMIREAGFVGDVGVLDVCAGAGHVWRAVRQELALARYVAFDRKPRNQFTLKGEAAAVLATIDLAPFNVIDIDVYGEPWEPLLVALPRLTRQTVILFTHGHMSWQFNPSHALRRAVGLPVEWFIPTPNADVAFYCGQLALASIWQHVEILNARRASWVNVSYWALRVRPWSQARRRRARRPAASSPGAALSPSPAPPVDAPGDTASVSDARD